VLVTNRVKPLIVGGQDVHQVSVPIHWGANGLVTGDAANELLSEVLDLNTHISEFKSLTCDIRAGRRPRGPARRALVEDYRRRGDVLHESRHDSRGGD